MREKKLLEELLLREWLAEVHASMNPLRLCKGLLWLKLEGSRGGIPSSVPLKTPIKLLQENNSDLQKF